MLDRTGKAGSASVTELMLDIGRRARAAASRIATAPTERKNAALRTMAFTIRSQAAGIIDANETDMVNGRERGLAPSFLDRLMLDADRIEAMAAGLEAIAGLPDPVGSLLAGWDRPNGLQIERALGEKFPNEIERAVWVRP